MSVAILDQGIMRRPWRLYGACVAPASPFHPPLWRSFLRTSSCECLRRCFLYRQSLVPCLPVPPRDQWLVLCLSASSLVPCLSVSSLCVRALVFQLRVQLWVEIVAERTCYFSKCLTKCNRCCFRGTCLFDDGKAIYLRYARVREIVATDRLGRPRTGLANPRMGFLHQRPIPRPSQS